MVRAAARGCALVSRGARQRLHTVRVIKLALCWESSYYTRILKCIIRLSYFEQHTGGGGCASAGIMIMAGQQNIDAPISEYNSKEFPASLLFA
jgi:hypothetical protein